MASRRVSRRKFIRATGLTALSLPVVLGRPFSILASAPPQGAPSTPPKSPRTTFNFNYDWHFLREDAPDGESPSFDDSKWDTVATPHSFNDVDSFRTSMSPAQRPSQDRV